LNNEGVDIIFPRIRKGIAPVVSTVILAAVVIAVGGAVWSYAQGASTVIANNYVNDTLGLVDDIIERFDIEHAMYRFENNSLKIWIYNFGDVDIIIDVYVTANSTINKSCFGEGVSSQSVGMVVFDFSSDPLESLVSIVIKAHSRRQNNAYWTYVVP